MLGPKEEPGIAKNVHAIEWLKTELATQLGGLYRALLSARKDAVVECLAAIISCSYLLARRLGVSFRRIDARIDQRLHSSIRDEHQLETWYGDLSTLVEYREGQKKGRE